MNVARSTFVRRGYLLTALAVAVLLAGSSGTAWAQTTTRFDYSKLKVFEVPQARCQRAQMCRRQRHRPLKVTIRRTTKAKNDPYNTSSRPRRAATTPSHEIANLNTTATLAFLLHSYGGRCLVHSHDSESRSL